MTPGRVGTLPALSVNNKGVTPQIALVAIGRSPERSFLCSYLYYPAIKKSGAWAPDWVIALREDRPCKVPACPSSGHQ